MILDALCIYIYIYINKFFVKYNLEKISRTISCIYYHANNPQRFCSVGITVTNQPNKYEIMNRCMIIDYILLISITGSLSEKYSLIFNKRVGNIIQL